MGVDPGTDLCPTPLPCQGQAARAAWAGISFLFHPVVSQQFLPDRAAQKPGNILLCQGTVTQLPVGSIWLASGRDPSGA